MQMFFLMCSERSGSNLITKIFDSHPDIAGPSTSHIADVILPNLHKYHNLKGSYWYNLLEDACYLLSHKNAIWKKQFTVKELQNAIPESDFAELLYYIYSQEAKANHKEKVLIKENRIHELSQFFITHFPNAQYLYMIRDPRDMAASWKNSFAIRGGIVKAAETWKHDQVGFLRMRHWLSPIKDIPIFKYEDLLKKPKHILTQVCHCINIKFHPDMLDFHYKPENHINAKAAADWQNISQPIMTNNFGKYKKTLSNDEIILIENLCYDEMIALGYIPENNKISLSEFSNLYQDLKASEPVNKKAYQLTSDQEKINRKKHHQKSTDIHNKPYTIEDLIQ